MILGDFGLLDDRPTDFFGKSDDANRSLLVHSRPRTLPGEANWRLLSLFTCGAECNAGRLLTLKTLANVLDLLNPTSFKKPKETKT